MKLSTCWAAGRIFVIHRSSALLCTCLHFITAIEFKWILCTTVWPPFGCGSWLPHTSNRIEKQRDTPISHEDHANAKNLWTNMVILVKIWRNRERSHQFISGSTVSAHQLKKTELFFSFSSLSSSSFVLRFEWSHYLNWPKVVSAWPADYQTRQDYIDITKQKVDDKNKKKC